MKKNGGFTLVELVVALAIIGIVIFIATDTYLGGIVSSKNEYLKSRLTSEARIISEGIMDNVKLAASVEESSGTYTTGSSTLILAVPAIDSSNNFIYSGNQGLLDHIVYTLEEKNLHKIIYSTNSDSRLFSQHNTDKIIAENVKSLIFTLDVPAPNTQNIDLNLTLENLKSKPILEFNLTTKGNLRNG